MNNSSCVNSLLRTSEEEGNLAQMTWDDVRPGMLLELSYEDMYKGVEATKMPQSDLILVLSIEHCATERRLTQEKKYSYPSVTMCGMRLRSNRVQKIETYKGLQRNLQFGSTAWRIVSL